MKRAAQQAAAPAAAAPEPGALSPDYLPHQLVAARSALMQPTSHLPVAMRPGAMDAAQLPRVHGNKRIWPDGRIELLEGC